jgi:flagellin-like protein
MYNPCLIKDRGGVSPVIAVILLVAITVVLVATLYFVVSGLVEETQDTPKAALFFTESEDVDGKFTGWVQEITQKVFLEDVALTLIDTETGYASTIYPLGDQTSAKVNESNPPLTISFDDVGLLGQLDGNDIFMVYNGTTGDRITLSYIPTDDLLGFAELYS